uniref:MADF domain-containing protein n=1 Tax=Amblyomma maculatum TaxID=34609 RepID=G3MKL8_AMBMU
MATNAKGTGMTSLRICAAPRPSLNRRLIAEVRKRPGLWKRGDDRLDRLQTHQAWCEIGAILNGVSPVAARKRWKNLKDVFARKYHALQKRRATEAGEGSGVITERWQYFKDLFFVRHALRDVITRDNEQPGGDVATDHDYASPPVGVAEAAAASSLDAPHTLDSSSEADTTGPAMPREMTNGLDGIESDTAESAQEPAVIDDNDDSDETSFLVQVPVSTELEEDSSTYNGCVPKRRRGPLLPDVQSMADVSVPIREPPISTH